ncbi:MAG TPA: autotransporter-associated beta strand repeat-containing protein, partial [Luteolibacter sp.]|nr:autotransporter-associated beta strand repeat-containing protein [Luteolibacter sp.]
DLTVRPAGDSAASTIVVEGNLSGVGKGVVKEGENLALILSGDNSHSGATRINGGLLRVDSATALGSGNLALKGGVLGLASGDFTRQLGTGAGQLDWNPGSGGFAAFGADREVRLNNGTGAFSWSSAILGGGNILILGQSSATHTLDFKNGISFAGSKRTIQVEDGAAALDATLSGTLSGGNSSGFSKTGSGALSLDNSNTYSGVTTVNEGVLRLQHVAALPSGNLELAGGILGLGADDMLARGIGTGTDQVQWTGEGGFAAYGADRAVKFSDSSINWIAADFIGNNRTLVLGHETADATLDWQQKISLAGNPRSIRVDDGSATIDARMSGTVAGGSSGTSNVFIKTGAGTLAFTSQNSYWGDTIVSGGILMIGDGGTTGGVSMNSPEIIVEVGATLAVNRADTVMQGSNPFAAPVTGDGNFAQTGPGTTVLTLANTYAGITNIDAGTLALGAHDVLPDVSPVAIGSATLDAATFSDTAGALVITANAIIRLDAGGALVFADSSGLTWTGALDLTGEFVSGNSLRFGDGSGDGLSAAQLTRISAAGFTNFGIDGSGFLTADAVSGSGFDTWKTVNSATGGLNDDHDGDGVTNGVEYFIGGPTGDTNGFTALPGVDNAAGTLSVTFTKAADYAGVYHTDFVVETSTTLDGWSPAPGGSVTFPSATEVKYTFPAGTKNFARLKVTGP